MIKYKIIEVDVNELHFDHQNPRIAEFNISPKANDEEILKILWDTMAVDEIVLSIAASGFFEHEPLMAIREKGKIIVIEGNRRLAAVKAIHDPQLLVDHANTHILTKVDPGIVDDIKKLPVIISKNREEAWKYIGFKHINGPSKWGSYAKAQYIAQIRKDFNIPLEQLAVQIGDTNKTVQKLYQGYRLIQQAEEEGVFATTDIKGSRLFFSHLYTAIGYEGVQSYLGIKNSNPEDEYPVDKTKVNDLGEFLTWLFGSKKKDINAVIESQNPDLRRLDSVLKSKEATVALKNGRSLISAYELSQPVEGLFEDHLVSAKQALLKATSFLSIGYNGEREFLQVSGDIFKLASSLYNNMETIYNEKRRNQPRNIISSDD